VALGRNDEDFGRYLFGDSIGFCNLRCMHAVQLVLRFTSANRFSANLSFFGLRPFIPLYLAKRLLAK